MVTFICITNWKKPLEINLLEYRSDFFWLDISGLSEMILNLCARNFRTERSFFFQKSGRSWEQGTRLLFTSFEMSLDTSVNMSLETSFKMSLDLV